MSRITQTRQALKLQFGTLKEFEKAVMRAKGKGAITIRHAKRLIREYTARWKKKGSA